MISSDTYACVNPIHKIVGKGSKSAMLNMVKEKGKGHYIGATSRKVGEYFPRLPQEGDFVRLDSEHHTEVLSVEEDYGKGRYEIIDKHNEAMTVVRHEEDDNDLRRAWRREDPIN